MQLVSLLGSPLVGYLSSHVSQPLVLGLTSILGTASFAGFAYLPRGGDPRSGIVWLYAVGMGLGQIGGIVISLALVAKGRGKIVASEGKEVGGVLSAAYSFCGGELHFCNLCSTTLISFCSPTGIGILVLGKLSGSLFDHWVGWPFLLVALVNAVVIVASLGVWWRNSRSAGIVLR